ncbi:MAG: (deoxy)nucleoside triphosphate pyrophosphohydrolase [Verrucomicrobiales bacterium]
MMEVVCAVIWNDDGRVLAAQRPPGKAQGGRWEFPGGKIEPGEAAEAALVREIEEELGCTLRVGAAMSPVDHPYPGGVIRLRPFLSVIVSGQPDPREHSALLWVNAREAAELEWAPADLPILAEIWEWAGPEMRASTD